MDRKQRAIDCYDAFTHEHRDRRTLLREMVAIAGSVAAAEALIAGIAASPAAATVIDPADPRVKTHKDAFPLGPKSMTGYFAEPAAPAGKPGAVIVVHENRGLVPHIEDVARRLAVEGFFVLAPDFLSDQGGTPTDENKARDLIAKADMAAIAGEAVATIAYLRGLDASNGRVGIIGFCWGGGLVDRVAIDAGSVLSAAVSYYGPAPDPAEASKVAAPMLLHYAGLDKRVDATGTPWTLALQAAGKTVDAYTYPGVNHAFNNDSAADRYNEPAATLAWQRTVAFLHKWLDGPG
jgi:carboxymethylenebutenolidase